MASKIELAIAALESVVEVPGLIPIAGNELLRNHGPLILAALEVVGRIHPYEHRLNGFNNEGATVRCLICGGFRSYEDKADVDEADVATHPHKHDCKWKELTNG